MTFYLKGRRLILNYLYESSEFYGSVKYFKINVWVNPDKSLNINDFVGPLGKFVILNDEFGLIC